MYSENHSAARAYTPDNKQEKKSCADDNEDNPRPCRPVIIHWRGNHRWQREESGDLREEFLCRPCHFIMTDKEGDLFFYCCSEHRIAPHQAFTGHDPSFPAPAVPHKDAQQNIAFFQIPKSEYCVREAIDISKWILPTK